MRMQEECKGSERIVTGDGSMMCLLYCGYLHESNDQ